MQYGHHRGNGLWVFFPLSIFCCVKIMCRCYCLFSFFNVLFPWLEIRTLACLFLQSYCISIHVAVIWFLFTCFYFLKCCLHVVLVQKSFRLSYEKRKKTPEKDLSCCESQGSGVSTLSP